MTVDRAQLRSLVAAAVDAGVEALADGLAQALPPPAPAGPVRMVLIADLKVAPELYQFRLSCIGKAGTDERLKDCAVFRRELAGVVLVWREPGGQLAILDGHHRVQLASRSGVEDLAVLEVQASSVREARRIGALANLAAGNATASDVARLLRDEAMTPAQVAAYGVSPRSKLLQDAGALVALAPDLFGLVCTGEMPLPVALALAAAGSTIIQRDLWREASRRGWDAAQIAEAATLARIARVSSSTPTGCLPGFEALLQAESSDLGALLAVRAAIRRQLATELRTLTTVSRKRSAQSLEDRGVAVVDQEAAAEHRDSSRAQARLFDQLAGLSGGLSATIRRLADEVTASGRSAADVVGDRLEEVRQAIEAELGH